MNIRNKIIQGDVLDDGTWKKIPDRSVHCVVTSPPYWALRDYKVDGQIGLEETPDEYIEKMIAVFRHVWRVLRDDGTLWLNMGDSYSGGKTGRDDNSVKDRERLDAHGHGGGKKLQAAGNNGKPRKPPPGLKPKDLCGMPWRLALALQADGWYLRQDIIWHKPSPMPESCRDRCTKAHEYIFLLTKKPRYYFDAVAIAEPSVKQTVQHSYHNPDNPKYDAAPHERWKDQFNGRDWGEVGTRNKRSVWTIPSQSYSEAHFATFPEALVVPCILAGTSEKGCCPQCGSPWIRVTEETKLARPRPNDYVKRTGEPGTGNSCPNSVAGVDVRTSGWRLACKCYHPERLVMIERLGIKRPSVPCIVMDLFFGSGTVGAVAGKLDRDYLGIELNPEYIKLAQDRIGAAKSPTTYVKQQTPDEAPLF